MQDWGISYIVENSIGKREWRKRDFCFVFIWTFAHIYTSDLYMEWSYIWLQNIRTKREYLHCNQRYIEDSGVMANVVVLWLVNTPP